MEQSPVELETLAYLVTDRDTVLMTAAMREQGGHDFEIGNDGFIFRKLSDSRPDKAIPIDRFDPSFRRKIRSSGCAGPLSGKRRLPSQVR